MGANNSTRRVSFESDENDNVTIVKGVRLSDNVINWMRESSGPQQAKSPPGTSTSFPQTPSPVSTPVPPSAPVESVAAPSPAEIIPSPLPVEPVAPPPSAEPVASPSLARDPAPPSVEITASLPPTEPVAPTAPSKSVASPALEQLVTPFPTDESELRRKISEEVQKGIQEERSRTQYEIHRWLEKERTWAKAQAHADAQAHVKDEVSRILTSERAAAQESVQEAMIRERLTAEEERRRTQLYAKKLEEKDQRLMKQDAFYREQVRKLEERSAQFYKVSNESYHKAADEVNAKFKRYEISPVCADLQGQVLKCYRENAGKTLLCSSIASLYMQCVNNAKQKLRTGG